MIPFFLFCFSSSKQLKKSVFSLFMPSFANIVFGRKFVGAKNIIPQHFYIQKISDEIMSVLDLIDALE